MDLRQRVDGRPSACASHQSRRRWIAAALATLLAVTACASGKQDGVAPASGAAKTAPADAWQTALANVSDDGTFTLPAALELFQVAFGDMPGAATPNTPAAEEIPDGTPALAAVETHESELTPAQRARVEAVLGDDQPTGSQIVVNPIAFRERAGDPSSTSTTIDPDTRQQIEAHVKLYRAEIAGKVGADIGGPIRVDFPPTERAILVGSEATTAIATTHASWTTDGAYQDCQILVYPRSLTIPKDLLYGTLAHEVTHCFQAATVGDHAENKKLPLWLVEGFAYWAEYDLTGTRPGRYAHWSAPWVSKPETPLFSRNYDAVGLFDDLAAAGIAPWSNFKAMFAPGLSNPARVTAARGDEDQVLDTWASHDARRPDLGAAWDGHTYLSADAQAPRQPLPLGGTPTSVSARPYTAELYSLLSISGDVLDITVDGHARIGDGHVDAPLAAHDQYCTRDGGCTCPGGGDMVPPAPLAPHGALLALTGGPSGTSATLKTISLDEFCRSRTPAASLSSGSIQLKTDDPCELLSQAEVQKLAGRPLPFQTPYEDDAQLAKTTAAINDLLHTNYDAAGPIRLCVHATTPIDPRAALPAGVSYLAVAIATLTSGTFPGLAAVFGTGYQDVTADVGLPAAIKARGNMITLAIIFDPTHLVEVLGQDDKVLVAAGKEIVDHSR